MADPSRLKIPSWQLQSEDDATAKTSNPRDADAIETTLDQARKFLNDENVRNSSTEKKIEFLESKGLNCAQVEKLLKEFKPDTEAQRGAPPPAVGESSGGDDGEDDGEGEGEREDEIGGEHGDEDEDEDRDIEQPSEIREDTQEAAKESSDPPGSSDATPPITSSSPISNPPPIITYPEFLTTPHKPPPLITPSRLANILAVSGSIWALLYGTARFAVNPMIDTLNDARADYYTHVSEKLGGLVEKLEDVVSEVPYKNGKPLRSRQDEEGVYSDNESTFSDPTELFHRDIGTQTSPLMLAEDAVSPSRGAKSESVDSQVRRLAALRASLRELNDMHIRRAENSADLNSLLRDIRDDVDKLGAPPMMDFSSIYGLGYGRSDDPDDEVKKTKDAIRGVKGMFLSARSFPTTTAR
ncbi:hypothetical protein AAE478_006057 [Parahypoxylon ruwenzoriense]